MRRSVTKCVSHTKITYYLSSQISLFYFKHNMLKTKWSVHVKNSKNEDDFSDGDVLWNFERI